MSPEEKIVLFTCLLAVMFTNSHCGYVITTPRKWSSNGFAQVCVYLTDMESIATGGSITVFLNKNVDQFIGIPRVRPSPPQPENESEDEKDLIQPKFIVLAPGISEFCDTISVPIETDYQVNMKIEGILGNVNVLYNKTVNIGKEIQRIFVQTDKYLYKPGQKIQFRILSVTGPFLKISDAMYDQIWIESPSGSRVAQWLNYSNSDRLIHLEFQLAEEPDEGTYKINVKQGQNTAVKIFKVEEFVLPRYEVTIIPPKYILGTDKKFNFTVCAKYTYGAPVKGNLNLTLDNSGWDIYKIVITKFSSINGCKDIEITSDEIKLNLDDFYVYNINAAATVVEEGTGIELKGDPVTASVSRTAINFDSQGKEKYIKPSLPFTGKVKAVFPDGSPAVNEPMRVCLGSTCKFINTDTEGLVTFVVPPEAENSVLVTALNYPQIKSSESDYRSIMYESSYTYYRNLFYSPSNSSLIIRPPLGSLSCNGQTSNIILPIMFAALNQRKANLHIQVVSRGQIQFMKSEEVEFVPGNLPIENDSLLSVLEPPKPGVIKGLININLELPHTVSPKAKIIVWYKRDDREVVADTQEVEMQKCLCNTVDLAWSNPKVEPGEQATLIISAEPNSICSLGVVDKSVELLSANEDDLTIDRVFDIVESAMISEYENSQSNDYEYCEKFLDKNELPSPEPINGPIPLPPRPIPEIIAETTLAPVFMEESDAIFLDNDNAGLAIPEIISEDIPTVFIEETDFDNDNEGPAEREKRSFFPGNSYYSDYSDALKMFDISGLYILSDLTVETRPCKQRLFAPIAFASGFAPEVLAFAPAPALGSPIAREREGPIAVAAPNENAELQVSNQVEKPRIYFPETWLWDILPLVSGRDEKKHKLPDTITEWVGKAVCVHPQKGLGLSPQAAITTFTPFFVDLTLPTTVKRGEIFPVKISVFNYENDNLFVKIILEPSEEYEILSEEKPQSEAGVRSSCVISQDKIVHTINIRPTALGNVNITLFATVDNTFPQVCSNRIVSKSDLLIKPIKVEAEGFLREKTWTKYICSNDTDEDSTDRNYFKVNTLSKNKMFMDLWQVEPPPLIVSDSARGWITAVGDLLGPTIENLGSLIRMPYGCGEQNMLNFAPNIFILQYLDASDQTTDEIANKATDFMRKGYQRELKYRRRDGSFSAFGERDKSGSTWLTAFVLKSFSQARQFIQVDEDDLQLSQDWLKLTQEENGCFQSVGKVFNKGMKGGISGSESPAPLTAYVMISLMEAGVPGSSEEITRAAYCLENGGLDPYTQALKAYALSLANHPDAQTAVYNLLSIANEDSSSISWEVSTIVGKSQGLAVETAGYAVLAMIALDAGLYNVQSRKVVQWMSSQRNGQGGFISTQDTVVALQAMASFEATQDQGPVDLSIFAIAETVAYRFTINENNKLLQQMFTLPSFPTTLSLFMSGTGCTLVQAVLRYNVPEPDPSEAFNLSISSEFVPDINCNTRQIRTCVSYLLPDGVSNMAVIEVDLISGYEPVKEDLGIIIFGNDLIKKYDVDDNLVIFYIDEFSSEETCVQFKVTQKVNVEDTRPGTVRVYDYYQSEFAVSDSYTFVPDDECLSINEL